MSNTNALLPDRVLDIAAKALGDGPPSLKTPYEAVALIGHACMAAVGFRLLGLGEDHNLGLCPSSVALIYKLLTSDRDIHRKSRPPRRMER